MADTRLQTTFYLFLLVGIAGCGGSSSSVASSTDPNLPIIGQSLSGKAMDGQQPIAGAHVYLLAANITGYGKASVSLLESASTGYSDSVGAYVLTAQDGSFSIAGTYSCPAGNSQVYVYVQGGNAGSGVNSTIGELAAIGNCPSLTAPAVSFVWVNEVSTVAAAYAMAGYAVDAVHVSSSGTTLAQTGVLNAFANAANLASLSTGAALAEIPSGNAVVPQSTINTLANILAACIGSAGPGSANCSTLFSNAESGSNEPTDTATAAINIAHSPAANVTALYALQTSASPYSPALTAVPNDFSVAINFNSVDSGGSDGIAIDGSGNVWLDNEFHDVIALSNAGSLLFVEDGYTDGLYAPGDIAIDQSGNAWVGNYEFGIPSNSNPYSLFEFSGLGTLLSGANGYTGGGLNSERGIAIDGTGDAWAVNTEGNSVSKFSSAGVPLSGSGGYAGGGMNFPFNIAIDASGNAWVSNVGTGGSVTKLSNSGAILSGAGFTDGGLGNPAGIAVDAQDNVWVTYPDAQTVVYNRVVKYSNSGEVLSGPNGFTGKGIGQGYTIAIDGAGNAWEGFTSGGSIITELSNSGTVLSGPNGYTNSELRNPYSIAIDGSGNVWVADSYIGHYNVMEFIGIAVPVVTPISAGLPTTPSGSSKLGTRP